MNEYFEGTCDVALAHGGTIEKIVGDATVADRAIVPPVRDAETLAIPTLAKHKPPRARRGFRRRR